MTCTRPSAFRMGTPLASRSSTTMSPNRSPFLVPAPAGLPPPPDLPPLTPAHTGRSLSSSASAGMRKILLLEAPPLPWPPFVAPPFLAPPLPFMAPPEPPDSAAWAAETTPRSRPVTELTAIGMASMANVVPPARISFLKLYAACVIYLFSNVRNYIFCHRPCGRGTKPLKKSQLQVSQLFLKMH